MPESLRLDLGHAMRRASLSPPSVQGTVTDVVGMLIEGIAHGAAVGDLYDVRGRTAHLRAEVVALRGQRALLLPFGHAAGLEVGARLVQVGRTQSIAVGPELLGRTVDALGRPLDGRPPPAAPARLPLMRSPLSMLQRRPVRQRLCTGVRALDAFVPCGLGQRLGIFAAAGVGKTTLMGMLTRNSAADVVVLALVGERGRELVHFVDEVLGPEGLRQAVVVAATSDRPASERVRAAFVATAIAEHFRDQGQQVLLLVDSLTRFCMAQREIGLAVGEPPTTKGYPPSAFALLPQLLERVAPARAGGSITGLYTVLVEGDDPNEPVADAARALLDGHVVLSRSMSLRGLFPAVDVLQSLSRLEGDLQTPDELRASRQVRTWLSLVHEARELMAVGAYKPGADPQLDTAIAQVPRVETFLRQGEVERSDLVTTATGLLALFGGGAP